MTPAALARAAWEVARGCPEMDVTPGRMAPELQWAWWLVVALQIVPQLIDPVLRAGAARVGQIVRLPATPDGEPHKVLGREGAEVVVKTVSGTTVRLAADVQVRLRCPGRVGWCWSS